MGYGTSINSKDRYEPGLPLIEHGAAVAAHTDRETHEETSIFSMNAVDSADCQPKALDIDALPVQDDLSLQKLVRDMRTIVQVVGQTDFTIAIASIRVIEDDDEYDQRTIIVERDTWYRDGAGKWSNRVAIYRGDDENFLEELKDQHQAYGTRWMAEFVNLIAGYSDRAVRHAKYHVRYDAQHYTFIRPNPKT